MGFYSYFARDYFLNTGNYPLAGTHYKCLLQHCFCFSAYVSFSITDPNSEAALEIKRWKVKETDGFPAKKNINSESVYYACEEIYSVMLSWADDLFDLCTTKNHVFPEDPAFYRSDGSVFFDSIIHEGECSLYPRNSEDISKVLAHGHWLYMNDKGQPEVPAKDHQFPFPTVDTICSDQLYRELIAIQQCPDAYISSKTVEEISRYVSNYRPHFLKDLRNLPPNISCIPRWYSAFEMYILGECCVRTSTKISTALESIGYCAENGFRKFFELLERYLYESKIYHQDSSLRG